MDTSRFAVRVVPRLGGIGLVLFRGLLGAIAMNATAAETVNFDDAPAGALPPGWRQGVTGRGAPRWSVERDASAPSAPNILKQSGSGTFPWCVLTHAGVENGF